MTEESNQANDAVTLAYKQFLFLWTQASLFKNLAEMGADALELLLRTDPAKAFSKTFEHVVDPLGQVSPGVVQGFRDLLGDISRPTTDRVAVIFAHTALETAVMQLLRAVSVGNPRAFDDMIRTKMIRFEDLPKGQEAIRHSFVEQYLAQLEREGLLKKVDVLKQLCPGDEQLSLRLDRDWLNRFDAVRHGIVHRFESVPDDLSQDDGVLAKLFRAFLYLGRMVERTHGLKADMDELVLPAL